MYFSAMKEYLWGFMTVWSLVRLFISYGLLLLYVQFNQKAYDLAANSMPGMARCSASALLVAHKPAGEARSTDQQLRAGGLSDISSQQRPIAVPKSHCQGAALSDYRWKYDRRFMIKLKFAVIQAVKRIRMKGVPIGAGGGFMQRNRQNLTDNHC